MRAGGFERLGCYGRDGRDIRPGIRAWRRRDRGRDILARGFWSILPHLDPNLLADILEHGRASSQNSAVEFSRQALDTDEFRARLGRIACGYDGGQLG